MYFRLLISVWVNFFMNKKVNWFFVSHWHTRRKSLCEYLWRVRMGPDVHGLACVVGLPSRHVYDMN